jgi:hypothetical protein
MTAREELRKRIRGHFGVRMENGEYLWHINPEFNPKDVYDLLESEKNIPKVLSLIAGTFWEKQYYKLKKDEEKDNSGSNISEDE